MNVQAAQTIPTKKKFSVGLTGGIGSGKSTVAAIFAECGAAVIDSDAISHRLTRAGGGAIPALRHAFGGDCIDDSGALDRPRMRELVFSDRTAKQRLESILHPLIRDAILAEAAASDSPYLLLVVPLLFEARGYAELVRRILVIDCAEQIQLARTMQRSGLSEQEVLSIMAQQASRTERLQRADDIIRNDDGLDELRRQVTQLHQRYLALASGNI